MDFCAHRPQTVEAGGGEVLRQAEFLKQRRLGGGDVGGRRAAVEIAEQHQEAAHERRVGVAAEVTKPVAHLAHDPRERDAASDPVVLGAFSLRQRRAAPGVVDDGGEPFLRIGDDGVVLDQLPLSFRKGHTRKSGGGAAACKLRGGRLTGGMVNPFAISWLWRGFKGRSVTFALLFASFVLGWSLSHAVNVLLTRLGVHWLYALILPACFFMWLAKREDRFFPDEAKRTLYARGLIAGSILLAIAINQIRH